MLIQKSKAWIKIISTAIILTFAIYDISWATDFTPIQKKQYVSNTLRLPMGFAGENTAAAFELTSHTESLAADHPLKIHEIERGEGEMDVAGKRNAEEVLGHYQNTDRHTVVEVHEVEVRIADNVTVDEIGASDEEIAEMLEEIVDKDEIAWLSTGTEPLYIVAADKLPGAALGGDGVGNKLVLLSKGLKKIGSNKLDDEKNEAARHVMIKATLRHEIRKHELTKSGKEAHTPEADTDDVVYIIKTAEEEDLGLGELIVALKSTQLGTALYKRLKTLAEAEDIIYKLGTFTKREYQTNLAELKRLLDSLAWQEIEILRGYVQDALETASTGTVTIINDEYEEEEFEIIADDIEELYENVHELVQRYYFRAQIYTIMKNISEERIGELNRLIRASGGKQTSSPIKLADSIWGSIEIKKKGRAKEAQKIVEEIFKEAKLIIGVISEKANEIPVAGGNSAELKQQRAALLPLMYDSSRFVEALGFVVLLAGLTSESEFFEEKKDEFIEMSNGFKKFIAHQEELVYEGTGVVARELGVMFGDVPLKYRLLWALQAVAATMEKMFKIFRRRTDVDSSL